MLRVRENPGSRQEVINSPSIINRVVSVFKKNRRQGYELEELIDIDAQLEIFRTQGLNALKAEKIYEINPRKKDSRLVKTQKEHNIACSHKPVNIELVGPETIDNLLQRGMINSHLGLFVIGVKALVRKDTGTKALVILYDGRWSDTKKSIIASAEIDLNRNIGLFYIAPDFQITTRALGRIKARIQSKGFEDFDSNSENLTVCTGFIGKSSVFSDFGNKLFTEETIEMLMPKGIKMIPAIQISAEDLAGADWDLSDLINNIVLVPQRNSIYEDSKGRFSIRFSDYTSHPLLETQESEEEKDE